MIFNPLALLLGRMVAKNQGASDATATSDGFLAGIVKSPVLGIALVSAIAKNQASPASTSIQQSSPLVVNATALSEEEIILIWKPIKDADSYDVIRLDRNLRGKQPWNTDVPGFDDEEVEGKTNYFYVVAAYNEEELIVTSSPVSVTTP